MIHKFRIGQRVECTGPRRNFDIPPGAHVIGAQLPERDGEFEYQVVCVVRESELSATRGLDNTSIPGPRRSTDEAVG